VIDAQREVHAVEQTRHGIGADLDAELLEQVSDFIGGAASPAQASDGIAGAVVLQQDLDGVD
jgi:hypothetical protein